MLCAGSLTVALGLDKEWDLSLLLPQSQDTPDSREVLGFHPGGVWRVDLFQGHSRAQVTELGGGSRGEGTLEDGGHSSGRSRATRGPLHGDRLSDEATSQRHQALWLSRRYSKDWPC